MKTTLAGLIPSTPVSTNIGRIILACVCFLSSRAEAAVDDWPSTAFFAAYDPIEEYLGVARVSPQAPACRPSVQISLDQNGQAIVTPAMLVLAPEFPLDMYTVDIVGPLTNLVTCDDIGQPLMAMVEDPEGNSCWSTLNIEDKLRPSLTCENDTIPCNEDILNLDFLSFLEEVDDNCDEDPDVYFVYTITELNCDPNGIAGYVEITYYATDDYGNTNSCTQFIYLEKFGLEDVEFPEDTVLNCDGGNPDPEVIGGPTIEGGPIHHFCELIAWHTDNVIPMCSGQTKIIRLWRVLDWCTGEMITDMQEILLIDTVPPELTCPPDITIGTSMLQCSASYILPVPLVTDVCSDDALIVVRFTISDVPGIFQSGQQVLLDLGPHIITVSATDDCYNTATCQYTVTVVDDDPPVLACSPLNIPLDAMGMAFLNANNATFNATDNCGIVLREIRRMTDNCDTPANLVYDSEVKFCCADIGEDVMVLFQATDVGGNVSTCMIQVTVKDMLPPDAQCRDACIFLGPAGTVTLSVDSIDDGSTDNCEIVSRLLSKTQFTCADLGIQVVTLTISDQSGNTASCTANVEVKDTIPPVAECQDITVELNEMGMVVITVGMIDDGSTDNCAIDTMYIAKDTFDCSDIGPNEVDLIVIDESGNADTCTAIVTVMEMPPMVMCMDVTVYLDEMGDVMITPDDVDGVTDDCSMPNREVTPDTFDCSNVGENIVTLTATDDSGLTATCTAVVTVVDSLPPVCLTEDIDVMLGPDGTASIDSNAVDNGSSDACGILSITVEPDTFDCNSPEVVVVTQTVTDVNGNTATCTASVTVIGAEEPVAQCMDITVFLDDDGEVVIMPGDVDDGSFALCGDITLMVDPSEFDCVHIGGNMVTLTVEDATESTATCTATVTVLDTIVPECVTMDVTVFLAENGQATIDVGDVDDGITDNCAIDTIVVMPDTFDCSDVGFVVVTVTATDESGNMSTCTAEVTVVDDDDPVCIAQDITVQLDGTGNATITAAQIDNGSFDNCGTVMLSVEPAAFTCDDVGDKEVVLTVTDGSGSTSTCTAMVTVEDPGGLVALCEDVTVSLDANGMVVVSPEQVDNGSGGGCTEGDLTFDLDETTFDCSETGPNMVVLTVSDMMENSATCTAIITVVDNIPPTIMCPPNMAADCDDPIDINNLTPFGTPTTSDNCPPVMVNETVQDNRNDCGEGTIVRMFVATDPSGNTSQCVQTITIGDPDPFDETDIIWPPAVVNLGQCSTTDPGPGNQPVIDAGTCSNISVVFIDSTTVTVDNNPATPCIEIVRKWTVIDSCQLMPGTMDGIFMFTQMITLNDNVGPVFAPLNDITVNADTVTCMGNATLIASATDCGMATPITNDFNAGGANASGAYPIGTTTVIFTSTDACGNISTMEVNVTVVDPIEAEFQCHKIIRYITEELEITVLAEEYVTFIPGACTEMDDFLYSYSPTDPFESAMVFDCGEVNDVILTMIFIYNLDGTPHDTCRGDLDFRDTANFCGDGLNLTGIIFGPNAAVIPNVPVFISETSMQTSVTNQHGRYTYNGLEQGEEYSISPFWNVNHKRGVSTLDLVAIQKHLLGIRELNSPYMLIAADANNGGSVTTVDMLEIRRLILDQIPAFTQNTSWRFIDAHFDFPDPQNPWALAFPEQMRFDPIMEHMTHQDFVGIKVGDVNNSVSRLQSEEVDVRSGKAMVLSIEEQYFKAGERADIPVYIADYNALFGYQFAMQYQTDLAALKEITFPESSPLTAEWFGVGQEGVITTLWHEPVARDVRPGEILFNLSFIVHEDSRSSEILSIDRETLSPEAYGDNDHIIPVRLAVGGNLSEPEFVVYQNVPNPFEQGTLIPVQIPEAAAVLLEVYSPEGKLVYRAEEYFDSGYHEFELRAGDLDRGGVYYYTISTAQFRGTRKMILME